MENPETPTSQAPVASNSDAAALQAQYASLRQTVISLLVLVIVLSGSYNLYLLRQVNYSRKDLEAVRQQAGPIITDYQTNTGPAMDSFLQKLAEYGRAHADFQPIVKKYGLDKPAPSATSAAPATATSQRQTNALAPAAKK